MRFFLPVLLLLAISPFIPAAHAAGNEDSESIDSADGIPYDRMVEKLSSQSRSHAPSPAPRDYFDDAKIHLGVAVTDSIYNLELPRNSTVTLNQTGFEVSLGMDLFSSNWAAEFAFLNFGQSGEQRVNAIQSVQVTASEFDLRFYFHTPVSRTWGYRMGSGLGSRTFHLDYTHSTNANSEFTVPLALFFGGAETYLSEQVSVGAELGIRTALITETAERTSLDLLLRVNGKF